MKMDVPLLWTLCQKCMLFSSSFSIFLLILNGEDVQKDKQMVPFKFENSNCSDLCYFV
jgi:hypothetical protein